MRVAVAGETVMRDRLVNDCQVGFGQALAGRPSTTR